MSREWDHKDHWRLRGKDFMVEVTRHGTTADPYFERGAHRWAVYAYIYPSHPHFSAFDGPAMWQPAASILPLHGGPSFLRAHVDADGKVTSYQVGADYDHLHDEHFTFYATKEDAREVFSDAEELHEWLSKSATAGSAQ